MNNMDPMNTPQGGPDNQQNEKTFTQEEVNKIVQERLAREQGKLEKGQAELTQRGEELDKREALLNARDLIQQNRLPEQFLNLIAGAKDPKEAAILIRQGCESYKVGDIGLSSIYKPPAGGNPPAEDCEKEMRKSFGLE